MTWSNRRASFVLVMACALAPGISAAQDVTGALIVAVADTQGAALRGARVRVSSPALIGSPQLSLTNARGQLRFLALPPGVYGLEIELTGFRSYREEEIRVGVGSTIERQVRLALADFTDLIVVPGTGSHLDARASGFETRFGPDDLKRIPVRRFSMFDFIRAAPGVSPTSPGSMTTNSVSAFGSGVNENAFLIDGTNFTCPCSGEARAEPGVDMIQEVQIQSAGASAEFGNLQGAAINVITRQGSDRFQSDASYYWQTESLTSRPVRIVYPGSTQPTSGYERVRYRDMTTNVGGPVVRDRIWFFAGYQYLRDADSQPGTDPRFPRSYEQDKVFGKLTWRLGPRWQLMQSFHREAWVNPEVATLVKPFEATQRRHASVPAMTFAHLTHTASSNMVWDIRVGRFTYTRKDDPSTGDGTIPGRIDRNTNVMSGAPQTFGGLTLIRTTAKGALNVYRPGLLGADHQWKVGMQIEKGEHRLASIIPTGVRYSDSGALPFQSIAAAPSLTGGVFSTTSAFASDAVTIRDRLTISAGLRYDHSRAISQDVLQLDLAGHETDAIVEGLGTLYTWNVLSPRLGVTLRLTNDGRTMIRGSYGRFNQGVLTGELSPIHPAATPTTTMAWSAQTNGYTTLVSVVDPRRNLELDPDTRTPRTDEYSVGIDRELGRQLSVAAAYVRKEGSHFIGWTDIGGLYREETRTLADGQALPVHVITNGTSSRRFLLTNPAGYSMTYNGLVLAVDRRRSNGWQLFGSYTASRTSGLQVSSGATAAGAQVSTIAGTPFLTFGQDPNSLTNARGRLPNDRPHMLRAMGSVDIPRTGFIVAANLQHFSGKPWAATALVVLPQGDQRILLEPRGTRRLPSQTLLDLRVSRPISLGAGTRAELLIDVFNLLNDSAAEGLASDNLFAGNFGQASQFADPRRAMLGVRLSLGQ